MGPATRMYPSEFTLNNGLPPIFEYVYVCTAFGGWNGKYIYIVYKNTRTQNNLTKRTGPTEVWSLYYLIIPQCRFRKKNGYFNEQLYFILYYKYEKIQV